MRCFPVLVWMVSLLPVAVQGKYHLAGSEEPIKARVGSDVVLPCYVEPPVDVRDSVVEWMFYSSKTVHLFRNEVDDRASQDERYKDRTTLNHKMLELGNISLKLTNIMKNDAGIYTCFVVRLPGQDKSEERNVTLVVGNENENEKENPDRRSGDENGAQGNLTDTGGLSPGFIAGVVVVVGALILAFILITYCAVRRRRGKQIFPRRSNNSQNGQRRNDGGMEKEQVQNHRGNENPEDETGPLQNQDQPNQSV